MLSQEVIFPHRLIVPHISSWISADIIKNSSPIDIIQLIHQTVFIELLSDEKVKTSPTNTKGSIGVPSWWERLEKFGREYQALELALARLKEHQKEIPTHNLTPLVKEVEEAMRKYVLNSDMELVSVHILCELKVTRFRCRSLETKLP